MVFGFVDEIVGERKRSQDDLREELDDYVWSDLVLRYEPFQNKGFSCAFIVKNLFDSSAFEPNDIRTPNDIPLPDRYFIGTLQYRF